MIRNFSLLFVGLTVIFLSGCSSVDREREKMRSTITELEPWLYADTVSALNTSKASELMGRFVSFAETYPTDSLSPEYLFKGAELAMNLKLPGRSLELYQMILNRYPDFEKAPYCLFMQAFIHENQLQQYDVAKALYQQFIGQYPDHELAEDARVSVEFMGRPLEDLIESWQKNE